MLCNLLNLYDYIARCDLCFVIEEARQQAEREEAEAKEREKLEAEEKRRLENEVSKAKSIWREFNVKGVLSAYDIQQYLYISILFPFELYLDVATCQMFFVSVKNFQPLIEVFLFIFFQGLIVCDIVLLWIVIFNAFQLFLCVSIYKLTMIFSKKRELIKVLEEDVSDHA